MASHPVIPPRSDGRDAPGADPTNGPGATLRGSADLHRLLVASVRDYAIFMLDPGGHVASWNEGAERIKGYTADEITGRHFSVFYPQEDLDDDKPAMELRVAAREGRFEDEDWRVRKDGTRFWANVVISAVTGEAGELVGFAKVTRDLTERREAEQRRVDDARRLAEAEAASRAKSGVLTTLSHELRTPLNAIGGYADLLLLGVHGPMSDSQREALDRILMSQRHLLRLITDMLDLGRIEAGRLTFDQEPVPLGAVAETVRPMIELQAAARRIDLEWQPKDPSVIAAADRYRVEQILLNLLSNAIKYTEPGGRVTVGHRIVGDRAILEVSDTGLGIPDDRTEEIFELFTQIGRSLANPHDGAGLGLPISRELARGMGGDLTVKSREGQGSVFTLALLRPDTPSSQPSSQ
jgi:PAS domain S-box-containing protein